MHNGAFGYLNIIRIKFHSRNCDIENNFRTKLLWMHIRLVRNKFISTYCQTVSKFIKVPEMYVIVTFSISVHTCREIYGLLFDKRFYYF